ncbi:MAG: hypothetical protein R8G66_07550 [Cytophagales bacterium]|nr:hypothetical protein [Cytophagales bacterium]
MNKIDIKQEAYFPFTFKLFGMILFAFGLLIWTQREWHFIVKALGMVVSYALGGSIVTARYGLLIDPLKKTIKEYVQVLFWKSGEEKTYGAIEKIFINEVTEAATFQTRTGSVHDVKNKAYKAFLKLDDDEKIQLDRDIKRDRLEERVQNYRDMLEVPE